MKTDIELVSIGTELLSGRTLNAHAQTLGTALAQMGLCLSRDTTIPDEAGVIQSVVREALDRVDIVIVSGGLGPTPDDITRDALAQLFNRKLISAPDALEAIKQRYSARGRIFNSASERMALILEGAAPLINSAGAAVAQRLDVSPPGLSAEASARVEKILFIVPGPPGEFAAVLDDHIAPWLCKTFPDATPLELRVLTTQGIGESDIVTRLEEANFQCPEISAGFYPGFGRVEIRLSAPNAKRAELDAAEHTLRVLLQDCLAD